MSIKNLLHKKKRLSPTEQWFYKEGGQKAITQKVAQYSGKGINQMFLSNLDLCPRCVDYRELSGLLRPFCQAIYTTDDFQGYGCSGMAPGQDDIRIMLDEGGVRRG